MVGDIGGFGEATYIFCLIFVSAYANRMYFADIIKGMFRVRLDAHGEKIEDLAEAKIDTRKRRSSFKKRPTAD